MSNSNTHKNIFGRLSDWLGLQHPASPEPTPEDIRLGNHGKEDVNKFIKRLQNNRERRDD